MGSIPKSEKGNNSVKYRQNFMKNTSCNQKVGLLYKIKSVKRYNSVKYLQNFANS